MFFFLPMIDERRGVLSSACLFFSPTSSRTNELSHFHSADGFASFASFSGASISFWIAFRLKYLIRAVVKIAYEIKFTSVHESCKNHEYEPFLAEIWFSNILYFIWDYVLCVVLPTTNLVL